MDQNPDQAVETGRKPYSRPHLRQVPLRPDEAVLGACKVTSGAGPGQTCGVLCSTAGS
jgi:hypothetical protein